MTVTKIVDFVKGNPRIVVLAVIIVILAVVAYMGYSGWQSAGDEKAKLDKDQKNANAALAAAQASYDLDKLRDEQASLTNSPSLAASFPDVDFSAYLGGSADKWGVDIVNVAPKGSAGSETIAGRKYPRYETLVQIEGEHERMNSFLRSLEEGPFTSLKIEGLVYSPSGCTFNVVIVTSS